MTCPHCKENRAHRSHRSTLKDRLMHRFQMIPYRCHSCKARFYAWRSGEKSDKMRTREERKIMELRRKLKWKNAKRGIVAYGFGALVFLGILYMIVQHRVTE